jgi:hypothetical protein
MNVLAWRRRRARLSGGARSARKWASSRLKRPTVSARAQQLAPDQASRQVPAGRLVEQRDRTAAESRPSVDPGAVLQPDLPGQLRDPRDVGDRSRAPTAVFGSVSSQAYASDGTARRSSSRICKRNALASTPASTARSHIPPAPHKPSSFKRQELDERPAFRVSRARRRPRGPRKESEHSSVQVLAASQKQCRVWLKLPLVKARTFAGWTANTSTVPPSCRKPS